MRSVELNNENLNQPQRRKVREERRKETEQARQQAEQAQFNAIPRLLELGLSIEQVANALSIPVEEVQRNLMR